MRKTIIMCVACVLLLMTLNCTRGGVQNHIATGVNDSTASIFQSNIDSTAIRDSIDSGQFAFIKKDIVNVRELPSTNSKILAKLKKGDAVAAKGQMGDWWYVITSDSIKGYILGSLLTFHISDIMDPFFIFQLGLNDVQIKSGLRIVSEIESYSESSIAIYLTNLWYNLAIYEKKDACLQLYNLWSNCLENHGINSRYAIIYFYDIYGDEVAKAHYSIWSERVEIELK